MTGELSGYLRQEFGELELLDEITKLCFHGMLSEKVVGVTHSQLISLYCLFKGERYMPLSMPSPLQWLSFEQYAIAGP